MELLVVSWTCYQERMIDQAEYFQEARKNAVALANAKESQQYQPALHQQVKLVDQQLKSVDQQLKLSDQPMKSEMQLKTFNGLSPVEQPDGNVVEKLKLAEKQEPDKQLKSAIELNSAEQQEPVEFKSVDDELKPAETAAQIEKEVRNGDVKIHVKQNAPPDKMDDKEEVMKINIEAGDDDEDAMEALLSHDMRETEIRWDFKSEIEIDANTLAQSNIWQKRGCAEYKSKWTQSILLFG